MYLHSLLNSAYWSSLFQDPEFSVQPICQECLFIYLSGNSTSGHYQNSLFHLKDNNLQTTSVCIFLQFPFTCFVSPTASLSPAQGHSIIGTIFGKAPFQFILAQWDYNIMQWLPWTWFINCDGVIDCITQFLASLQQCSPELKKKCMGEGNVDESI